MAGSLNNFLQHFQHGFVHPNLFRVYFTGSIVNKYGEILTAACKSATIPGTTFTENKFYHEGFYNKFVSGADYDPFTCVFLVDAGKKKGDSKIISCFDEWNTAIYDDGKFGFKNDYKCDIRFEMLNRDGSVLYETTVIDAYPTNISAFELSSDLKFNVMEYSIMFNFLKFKTTK